MFSGEKVVYLVTKCAKRWVTGALCNVFVGLNIGRIFGLRFGDNVGLSLDSAWTQSFTKKFFRTKSAYVLGS